MSRFCLRFLLLLWPLFQTVSARTIQSLQIRGNQRIETSALTKILTQKEGEIFCPEIWEKDLKKIYELGYFSKIFLYEQVLSKDSLHISLELEEKPMLLSLSFQGNEEIREEDFKDALKTKLYSFLDEGKLNEDVKMIQKKYKEKGFFLVQVQAEKKEKNGELSIVFSIKENAKVLVGDVHILGAKSIPLENLYEFLSARPTSRSTFFSGQDFYSDEAVQRDSEVLGYLYRDRGYAQVQVATPKVYLDPDRKFVRILHEVEEGPAYRVGLWDMKDERALSKEELWQMTSLKPGDLFSHSAFVKDIETLMDDQGDKGYAYADVQPHTVFQKETGLVDVAFEIHPGPKVYFGNVRISGHTKTRDHVIRRECSVSPGELYKVTKLTRAKQNLERLGFFEEIQIIKERDPYQEDIVHLLIKVKEKSTGQMNMSLAMSPTGENKTLYGEGRYEEKNQSGQGWETGVSARWGNSHDYRLDLSFYDPKVQDGPWSLGGNIGYQEQITQYGGSIEIPEERKHWSINVGRDLWEKFRGHLALSQQYVRQKNDVYVFDGYEKFERKHTLRLALSRKVVDHYLDPTEGSWITTTHSWSGGGILGGDEVYGESTFDGSYYIPWKVLDYRTYFRFHGFLGQLWSWNQNPIPASERYRLGGYDQLRGFRYQSVGPTETRRRAPSWPGYAYNLGGDQKAYWQVEYFLPLIPQAGMKGLLFLDCGRVAMENETLWGEWKKDMGFGLRWITPLGPFRFEWAFPYSGEGIGDMEFIFTLGY